VDFVRAKAAEEVEGAQAEAERLRSELATAERETLDACVAAAELQVRDTLQAHVALLN
jgi:hypothetical protein